MDSINNSHQISFGQIKINKSVKKYANDSTKKVISHYAFELAKMTDNVYLELSMKETGSYMLDHKFHKTGRVLYAEVSNKAKSFWQKLFSKRHKDGVGKQIKDVENIRNDVSEIISSLQDFNADKTRDKVNKTLFG